ncbi:MAG: hypothetical protein H7287_06250 [Thermoleophilia bacterium]|nr:hypothetical protein [Thermoleophilia bacterium]
MRAWNLALMASGDEVHAADAIVAVFGARANDSAVDWSDDAQLLRDVRRRALTNAAKLPPHVPPMWGELAAMPPLHREAVELAMVGRCTPTQIARVLGSAPSDVTVQLTAGLKLLAGSVRRGGVRLQV